MFIYQKMEASVTKMGNSRVAWVIYDELLGDILAVVDTTNIPRFHCMKCFDNIIPPLEIASYKIRDSEWRPLLKQGRLFEDFDNMLKVVFDLD